MKARLHNFAMLCLGLLSVMYLLNIGAGIFELIPDNFPFIGNLDEAGALVLLMMCLRHFNLDPLARFSQTQPPANKHTD